MPEEDPKPQMNEAAENASFEEFPSDTEQLQDSELAEGNGPDEAPQPDRAEVRSGKPKRYIVWGILTGICTLAEIVLLAVFVLDLFLYTGSIATSMPSMFGIAAEDIAAFNSSVFSVIVSGVFALIPLLLICLLNTKTVHRIWLALGISLILSVILVMGMILYSVMYAASLYAVGGMTLVGIIMIIIYMIISAK